MVTGFEEEQYKINKALLAEIRNLTAEVKALRQEVHELRIEQEISNGSKVLRGFG